MKQDLAVLSLSLACVIAGLFLIGYGLHMFNTLQFITGFITAGGIAGACINTLFFEEQ